MIVGFPTENEAEFEESYQNLQKMPLHYYHVLKNLFLLAKKQASYHLANIWASLKIQERL